MSAFGDFRRGFRVGLRGSSAARQDDGGFAAFDHEGDFGEPRGGFGGDELAECKAVIAGLLEQLAQWKAAVAERDEYIAALAEERDQACEARDRYQANGKRAVAQLHELETIIAFPGVKTALVKALHPDPVIGTGGDVAARTAAFQTLMAALGRLGLGR